VKVRIITDNDTAADPGSDIQQLQDMKIEVKFDKTEFHMVCTLTYPHREHGIINV
jgi:hypothetical protein